MSIMVLDTDHITLFQNNHPLVTQKVNQVSQLDQETGFFGKTRFLNLMTKI